MDLRALAEKVAWTDNDNLWIPAPQILTLLDAKEQAEKERDELKEANEIFWKSNQQLLAENMAMQEAAERERDAWRDAQRASGETANRIQDDLMAAYERAAKVCDDYAGLKWAEYKRGNGQGRADPHWQGQSDGADDCANAIRALNYICRLEAVSIKESRRLADLSRRGFEAVPDSDF